MNFFSVRKANENINFVYPCMSRGFGTHIECRNITLSDVRTAFHNASHGLFFPSIVLLAPLVDYGEDKMIKIPADLLGDHSVDKVLIDCSTCRLSVHPDAFRFSASSTYGLVIKYCDLSSTDFNFLKSFRKLEVFELKNCDNVNLALWNSTAPLPTILSLIITKSNDLNKWTQFPHLTGGLQSVDFSENSIGNEAMDRILRWISSFSASILTDLTISHNNLTSIPQLLTSFTVLDFLDLRSQHEPGLGLIPAGALNLSSPILEMVILEDCGITAIEPGAIQGVFYIFKHSRPYKIIIT